MIDQILVANPTGDDLEFEGELVVDEHHHDLGSAKVWKTRGGRYVLQLIASTRPGFRVKHRVERFETVQDLSEALGHSQGAKAVLRKLGMSRKVQMD
jgi:hypothetical protein